MTADLGIIHSASMWLDLHGDDGVPEARKMAATMRARGDLDGADTWLRIIVQSKNCGAPLSAWRHEERATMRTLMLMAIPAMATLLSACGAGEVMETAPSTYQVTAQEGLLTGGWPAAQKDALAKGNQFCTAKGQHFNLIQGSKNGMPGWTPLSFDITFTCGADVTAEAQELMSACVGEMQTAQLDLIRSKLELYRGSPDVPPPFEIAANDTFPTESERPVIANWATIRDECIKRGNAASEVSPSANPLQVAFVQQDRSFAQEAAGHVSALVIALYQGKMTYGEFAQKRYEIGRDAAAAERQFRAATLIADRERQVQAQQLAQQQFQNNLIAWSTYMQTVNARQPQTVYLSGSVRLKTNCSSQQLGNFVNTDCN